MKFAAACLCVVLVAFASANEDEWRDAVRDMLSGAGPEKRALVSALSSGAIMKAADGWASNLGQNQVIGTPQSQTFIDSCLGAQNNIIRPTFKPFTLNPFVTLPWWNHIGKRAEEKKTLNNRDVIFVLDTSGSISQDNFDKAKKSIVMLMEAYCPITFGNSVTAAGNKQIAVILFDGSVTTEVDFSESARGFGYVQDKIMSIKHRKGSTATANALKYVRNSVLGKGSSRLSNEQVATDVIVVTDGQCNVNCGSLGSEANLIRKMGHGVNLFAMGVGRARACELEIITGTGDNMGFDLGNFENVDQFALAVKELADSKEAKCV